MTDTLRHPYVPTAASSAILLLGVLVVVTAAPAVFIAREESPPVGLTAASFALVFAAFLVVPALNHRAPAAPRTQRTVILVAITAAIVVPLALLYPAVAIADLGWLFVVGVAVQALLLIAVAIGAARHRSR
ncbi:hypothetical protein [Leifsonia aquatica]|uniref:Uncharacterized protein n=2 Tax=Leifsonia aquatica TaxID=144185 RepID=U2RA56_LEIAQ|nr:hypothetical protein [Leifsonia aquatica]ERK72140.1 hypothetical protein N136_01507 [Leifsonia aquatica ATCC 14665]MBB2968989.1 membrane associated rhomboid family serine protease [Leifsonia aquatica]